MSMRRKKKDLVGALHPMVQESLGDNRRRARKSASKGKLPNVTERYYVLFDRPDLTAGEIFACDALVLDVFKRLCPAPVFKSRIFESK